MIDLVFCLLRQQELPFLDTISKLGIIHFITIDIGIMIWQ